MSREARIKKLKDELKILETLDSFEADFGKEGCWAWELGRDHIHGAPRELNILLIETAESWLADKRKQA